MTWQDDPTYGLCYFSEDTAVIQIGKSLDGPWVATFGNGATIRDEDPAALMRAAEATWREMGRPMLGVLERAIAELRR